jgi:hypothetical protein
MMSTGSILPNPNVANNNSSSNHASDRNNVGSVGAGVVAATAGASVGIESVSDLHNAVLSASRMTAKCLSHDDSLPPYMERFKIFE